MPSNNEGFLGGGVADLVSTLKGIVTNLSLGVQAFSVAFPRINGTFALSAATVSVITEPRIASNGIVFWSANNTTAALIMRTNGLFQVAGSTVGGTSFTMSTQAGSAVAGSVFSYIVINPG